MVLQREIIIWRSNELKRIVGGIQIIKAVVAGGIRLFSCKKSAVVRVKQVNGNIFNPRLTGILYAIIVQIFPDIIAEIQGDIERDRNYIIITIVLIRCRYSRLNYEQNNSCPRIECMERVSNIMITFA